MRVLSPGTWVFANGKAGTIKYARMASPTFSEVDAYSVILDSRKDEPGYEGTLFNAEDVHVTEHPVVVAFYTREAADAADFAATGFRLHQKVRKGENIGYIRGDRVNLFGEVHVEWVAGPSVKPLRRIEGYGVVGGSFRTWADPKQLSACPQHEPGKDHCLRFVAPTDGSDVCMRCLKPHDKFYGDGSHKNKEKHHEDES